MSQPVDRFGAQSEKMIHHQAGGVLNPALKLRFVFRAQGFHLGQFSEDAIFHS